MWVALAIAAIGSIIAGRLAAVRFGPTVSRLLVVLGVVVLAAVFVALLVTWLFVEPPVP
jgi:hypothetical protein